MNTVKYSSFLAVYIIWGSTYLAILYAIESFPPWLLTSGRFFLASSLIGLIAWFRKETKLTKDERKIAILSGLLLVTANGIVAVVEKWVSSGLTAVLIGAMPIWIMLIGWMMFGESRPTLQRMLGALVGLFGIFLIAAGHFTPINSSSEKWGILILFGSSWLWATGTVLQRKVPNVKSAFRFSCLQMFSGAVLTGFFTLASEKPWQMQWSEVSTSSWWAYLYLVVFGSVIGLTAYAWLSRNVESHLVSTYALVNPVIAVWLGWLFFSEPVTPQFLLATFFVLIGITLLIRSRGVKHEPKFKKEKSDCADFA